MTLTSLGEFGLIERLKKGLGRRGQGVAVGIGDDAAVVRTLAGRKLLLTCDMSVEGVHFSLKTASPEEIGYRAVAAAVSDIAAMAGRPRWALTTLGVRPGLPVRFFDDIYRGIRKAARKFELSLVGGDTVTSPKGLLLDVFVAGEEGRYGTALRSGARPGDGIYVTGSLGNSAAGLYALQHKLKGRDSRSAARCHLTPEPRVREAIALMKLKCVRAMMDVSDGLSSEIHHLCQESGCGALILERKVPIAPEASAIALTAGQDAQAWALHGGEEYELVFTGPVDRVPETVLGLPVHFVGRVVQRRLGVRLVRSNGRIVFLKPQGFRHF